MVFNPIREKLGRSVFPWLPFNSNTEVRPLMSSFPPLYFIYKLTLSHFGHIFPSILQVSSLFSTRSPSENMPAPKYHWTVPLPAYNGVNHGLCGTAKKCDMQQMWIEVRNKLCSHDYGRCWWHWCSVVIDRSADRKTSAYPLNLRRG
jgi:hypothetical protein